MRSVCVVTGSRAEYGLLSGLLDRIAEDSALAPRLLVTGSHLSPHHGMTVREIEADGRAFERVDMLLAGDTPLAVAKSVGLAVIGLAEALARMAPDLVVVLGDRYEILAAAQAALLLGLPLAHIHGGEVTEGAIDESIRHAVTKMAHLHFVAAEPYRRRAIQLGERPESVFNVGALAADNLRRLAPLSRAELERDLGIALADPILLLTYHPTTADPAGDAAAVAALEAALAGHPAATLVVTGVNADAGGGAVAGALARLVTARANAVAVESLGWRRYLSLLALSSAMVGNSSSGMTEAPMMKVPTVNIGSRQKGRLRPPGVIDCAPDPAAVAAGLARALDPAFRAGLAAAPPPFGDGRTAERIVAILRDTPLDDLRAKPFHDL